MKFVPTPLAGATLVELDPHYDQRGFFARSFCAAEFAEQGLEPSFVQANVSYNVRAGTLRGLHYQLPPAAETKLVRCIRGAVFDVIVDLRPDSASFLQHFAVELSHENRRALYVPALFAHGFMTLTDDAEVLYLASVCYTPDAERGIRYDDPALSLGWPQAPSVISDKDLSWPRFSPCSGGRDR